MEQPDDGEESDWIQLSEKKQFSRLLYTNPVCFLSTAASGETDNVSDADDESKQRQRPARRNVMVLSWLTPTNNNGRFMFSLNRHRYTASRLREGSIFVLSIPVEGMEDLVRSVGSVSGRFGSKFQHDHETSEELKTTSFSDGPSLSKRQKKKQEKENFANHGIPALEAVVPGTTSAQTTSDDDGIFAIRGTVAHLVCQIYKLIEEPVIDDSHLLVLASVESAFARKSYWNQEKNLFQPQGSSPPYLTFFGAQIFGYTTLR